MEKILKYIKYIIVSLVTGITSIMPGVSGGTIIAIFGLSEELTLSIQKLTQFKLEYFKKYLALPLIIGVGSYLSSLFYAKVLVNSYSEYEVFLRYSFLALVVISLPTLWEKTNDVVDNSINGKKNKKLSLLTKSSYCVAGFIIAVILSKFGNDSGAATVDVFGIFFLIKFTIVSFLSGITTILPGISGTNILMIFGEYNNYVIFTSQFSTHLLQNALFLIGTLFGAICSAYILNWIFKNYNAEFFSFMTGLTASTVLLLYINPFENIVQSIVGLIVGILFFKVVMRKK